MTEKQRKILTCVIFSLSTIILIIKCFYSFCWSDETFYFATSYRFFQGDSIFKHEWFPTQLSSVVLLPLFSLYVLITGSTTGIILYFRILFVIYSLINAIITYRILKEHASYFTALSGSLMLLFYTHLNIATLSYYTLSVQLYFMSMLLLYHYYFTKSKKTLVVTGVLFAICVLSLPTLVIAYFLVMILIGISIAIEKYTKNTDLKKHIESADLKNVAIFTFFGILIPAILFFIFMFCNVSIKDFIAGIPYVLSDEEHGTSFIYPMKKFFIGINEVYGKAAYLGYLLIMLSAFLRLLKIGRSKVVKSFILYADILLFIAYFIYSFGHTGYIQTALCLFALPLFFQTEKRNYKNFFLFVLSGAIFALVYSYSSNGYLYILSMGHFIASIGCLTILERFTLESTKETNKKLNSILITTIILVVLIQTMALRITNIYRDAALDKLNSQITDGPAKGLYTTEAHLDLYNKVYSTITDYCQSSDIDNKQGSIFITKLLPFGYMCTDLRCAAPTTWRTQFNSERLEPYYEMNPDRYPDLILVLDEEYGTYDTAGDVEYDPNPNANEIGGFLLDYVNSSEYELLDVPCGVLFKKL